MNDLRASQQIRVLPRGNLVTVREAGPRRLQAIVHQVSKMVLERKAWQHVVQTLCQLLVREAGFASVCLGLKEADGSARPSVCEGLSIPPTAWRWDETPGGDWPAGAAIRTGTPQVVPAAHTCLAPWSSWLAMHGLKLIYAFPLSSGDRTIGALVLCTTDADSNAREISEQLVHLMEQLSISLMLSQNDHLTRLHMTALEAAAHGVILAERSGRILWVNASWSRMSGYTAAEVEGQTPRIVKSGHHAEAFYRYMWETILDGRFWTGEVFNRNKDGSLFVVDMSITPVRDESGTVTHFVAVWQDISDRLQQEQHLRTPAGRHLEVARTTRPGGSDEVRQLLVGASPDRFALWLQPIVHLETGEHHHCEALMRLVGEGGRIISPAEFLPVAEEHGLMHVVDRRAVEALLLKLPAMPGVRCFVNLSGQSLGDPELLDWIEQVVRDSGRASQIGFEVTETAVVRELDVCRQWMWRLRGMGVKFALDDFGTGFSSFYNLRALPVDTVKIEGSFVRNLSTDFTNQSLVEAISKVAHALGKQVVAEWVETESSARILREYGIEFGQGKLWGMPAPELPRQGHGLLSFGDD